MGGKQSDLIGQKFGRLTVVSYAGMVTYGLYHTTKTRNRTWLCECDCGNTVTVVHANLIRGNTKSCGCLQHDSPQKTRLITFDGKTMRLKDWAKTLDISSTALAGRLEKYPIEIALTMPKAENKVNNGCGKNK